MYVEWQLIAADMEQQEFERALMPAIAPILAWQLAPFRHHHFDFATRPTMPRTDPAHAKLLSSVSCGMHPDLPYFERAYMGVMHLLTALGANVRTANHWIHVD